MLDARSEKYLEAIEKHLGVVGWNEGMTEIQDTLKKRGIAYEQEKLSSNIDLVFYTLDGRKRYAAQWISVAYPDDAVVVSVVFDGRKPSLNDMLTAKTVREIKNELTFSLRDPEFCCYVCLGEKHWLDIRADSVEEKWENRKERYCGC